LTRLVSVITGKLKEFPVEAIEKGELVIFMQYLG